MTTPYLASDVARDEALRLKAYPDPKSGGEPWTIGYGHTGPEVHEGLVWTAAQAEIQLEADLISVERSLDREIPWWRKLTDVRQDVLAAMAFNCGVDGLMGFRGVLAAARDGDFDRAAWNMLWNAPGKPTQWSHDVGTRAIRLSTQMATGRRSGPSTPPPVRAAA